MFWGLVVLSGKVYQKVLDSDFKVTMASLGPDAKKGQRASLLLKTQNTTYCLCILVAGTRDCQPLSLSFSEGEDIAFTVEGDASVHLTGALGGGKNGEKV